MSRPEAPRPLVRRGPRPLALHLGLAWARASGLGALPTFPPDVGKLFGGGIADRTGQPGAFPFALDQDRKLIAGIAAYRASPYVRQLSDPPVIWSADDTKLYDYGGEGPRVLFVPSLVNRSYILDLMEGSSMMRWLASFGVHPYLLDWGWPQATERAFNMTDYVLKRLEPAAAAIPGPVILAGYCMGGLLTLAATARDRANRRARISALALLATPWDFHAADEPAARRVAAMLPALEPVMEMFGTLPIDVLNALFTMIDSDSVAAKYRDFSLQAPSSPRAQKFVAIEDWLADGLPLAAPVARETLGLWYGENATAHGRWCIAGQPVELSSVDVPVLCAIPAKDRLVPAASARALAAQLTNVKIIEPDAGHIGMVAGTHAQTALWEPFAAWLHAL